METKVFIAQRIQELRIAHDWTQTELGAKFDPPKSGGTISSWEKARTTPDADSLLELCQIFGVDISAFFPPNEYYFGDFTKDETNLIDLFRALSPNNKKVVLSLVYLLYQVPNLQLSIADDAEQR